MPTIRNTTTRPLKVHLAKDKVLHLGPARKGQISPHDVDSDGVRHLLAEGAIELLDGGRNQPLHEEESHVHADTHGHHPDLTVKKRGER